MDLPADVLLHNEILGIKGGKGTLIMVSPHGFYEVKLTFGGKNIHRVLLPVDSTVVIFREPEPTYVIEDEIER
ncbi:MAG: hypothetical protein AAGD38_00825 [Acidobacteriota bacterium]